jgi:hypothetical protein
MSIEMYNALLCEVRREVRHEVCLGLSLGGFGDYNSMLKAVGSAVDRESDVVKEEVNSVVKEVVKSVVKKSEVKKSEELKANCVLPWCGSVIIGKCSALKLNSGLYTQCMKNCDSKYCGPCEKLVDKNGGTAPYGTIEERLNCDILEYKDPKGKQVIPYGNVMKKLNIDKEEALKEAEKMGWTIPECQFELKSSKRGRPKKDTSAEDTESEAGSESGEKKKRGRPKKEKEIVTANVGEDLIASLIQDSQEEKIEETTPVSGPVTEVNNEELKPSEIDEDDETNVVKFEIDGKTYLKSDDNVLFDMNSHDCVGLWNEESKSIDEIPDEDDEEED